MVADARAVAGVGTTGALLDVQDLHVTFDTADGTLHAVRGASFGDDFTSRSRKAPAPAAREVEPVRGPPP